jgi:hypothetical protein
MPQRDEDASVMVGLARMAQVSRTQRLPAVKREAEEDWGR